MAILKFRVYFEEDDSIYRDVVLRHTQSFLELHQIILRAYEFDTKHQSTFYRSNDSWQRGREISLEKYDLKTGADGFREVGEAGEVVEPDELGLGEETTGEDGIEEPLL